MITETPMDLSELLAVVAGAQVELGPDARSLIQAGRAIVDSALTGEEPVYGLNTGVGHMKDQRVGREELGRFQEWLLETHEGGLGEPLPSASVRAAMVTLLNKFARGGSGVSLAVAETIAAMLNAGVRPVLSQTGSVGAADLGQMAQIGLVLIGRGSAEIDGDVVTGREALSRAGIPEPTLQARDGLALISTNGVSIGEAAILLERGGTLVRRADGVVALSLESIRGNPSIVHPAVGRAKPFPGLIASCEAIREALVGGDLVEDPASPRSVQDPLSFRVAPQVHGAFRDAVTGAEHTVGVELNARSDNPLVAIEDGVFVHNGNFHPIHMALAMDGLRLAAVHVGQLSERRMDHLWNAYFQDVAPLGNPRTEGAARVAYGAALRYSGAATYAELRQLAAPATLDVPPLDMGIEDHATGAPLAVRITAAAFDLLDDLLAIEILLARDVLETLPVRPVLGVGARSVLEQVDEMVSGSPDSTSASQIHRMLIGSWR